MDYEAEDKAALTRALIAIGRCAKCRRPLRVAWSDPNLVCCVTCELSWPKPDGWTPMKDPRVEPV